MPFQWKLGEGCFRGVQPLQALLILPCLDTVTQWPSSAHGCRYPCGLHTPADEPELGDVLWGQVHQNILNVSLSYLASSFGPISKWISWESLTKCSIAPICPEAPCGRASQGPRETMEHQTTRCRILNPDGTFFEVEGELVERDGNRMLLDDSGKPWLLLTAEDVTIFLEEPSAGK
jgi:hypothetical protein